MTTQAVDPDLVPLSEASRVLQMNREKVLRRIQDGRIDGTQLLGRWFVRRSALRPEGAAA
jgi:hypothetical protein